MNFFDIPVVPHKAVAEVSEIGNLEDPIGEIGCCESQMSEQKTDQTRTTAHRTPWSFMRFYEGSLSICWAGIVGITMGRIWSGKIMWKKVRFGSLENPRRTTFNTRCERVRVEIVDLFTLNVLFIYLSIYLFFLLIYFFVYLFIYLFVFLFIFNFFIFSCFIYLFFLFIYFFGLFFLFLYLLS